MSGENSVVQIGKCKQDRRITRTLVEMLITTIEEVIVVKFSSSKGGLLFTDLFTELFFYLFSLSRDNELPIKNVELNRIK